MHRFLALFKKTAVRHFDEPLSDTADKPVKSRKAEQAPFTDKGLPLVITSPFGERSLNGSGTFHQGVDIRSFTNDFKSKLIFLLPEPAKFIRTVTQKEWGVTAVFKTDTGRELKYTHISLYPDLHFGKTYPAGSPVCSSASPTDYMLDKSFAEHLHFEVWENGKAVNPIQYLDSLNIKYRWKNVKE